MVCGKWKGAGGPWCGVFRPLAVRRAGRGAGSARGLAGVLRSFWHGPFVWNRKRVRRTPKGAALSGRAQGPACARPWGTHTNHISSGAASLRVGDVCTFTERGRARWACTGCCSCQAVGHAHRDTSAHRTPPMRGKRPVQCLCSHPSPRAPCLARPPSQKRSAIVQEVTQPNGARRLAALQLLTKRYVRQRAQGPAPEQGRPVGHMLRCCSASHATCWGAMQALRAALFHSQQATHAQHTMQTYKPPPTSPLRPPNFTVPRSCPRCLRRPRWAASARPRWRGTTWTRQSRWVCVWVRV